MIAVDLFGQPAEYDKLHEICDKYDMYLFEDGAQGFGGAILDSAGQRKMACSLGNIATTSFFRRNRLVVMAMEGLFLRIMMSGPH